jgi:hypothetical protein
MKDTNGDHTTPKWLAEQILMDALNCKMEFFLESVEIDHLTKKQQQQVFNQAQKIGQRIAKTLHFEADSFQWSID